MEKVPDISFKNDTIFYGFAVFIERAASFFVIPILTKTLPQEYYGIWTQILITTALMGPIIMFGFYPATVKFLSGENNKIKVSKIFHGMLLVSIINLVLVCIACFGFAVPLSRFLFGDAKYFKFVHIFGLFLASESLFQLLLSYLRAIKKIKIVSVYYLIKNAVRLSILAIGTFIFKVNLLSMLQLLVLSQIILVMIIYLVHISHTLTLCRGKIIVGWKGIIYFALPLIPYSLFLWGNSFIDRYFILHILNINQLSKYAIAYSLAAFIMFLYSISSYTLYPHMAKLWNTNDKNAASYLLSKVVDYYLFLSIPIIIILSVFHTEILKIVSNASYFSSWQVVFFLTCGVTIFGLYQLTSNIMLLAEKTMLIFYISLAAVLTNVLLNIFLIPIFGILGAAISMLFSNIVLTGLTIFLNKKIIEQYVVYFSFIKILPGACAMLISIMVLRSVLKTESFFTFILAACVGLSVYLMVDLFSKNSKIIGFIKPMIKT